MKRTAVFILVVGLLVCAFAQQNNYNPWAKLLKNAPDMTITARNTSTQKDGAVSVLSQKVYISKGKMRSDLSLISTTEKNYDPAKDPMFPYSVISDAASAKAYMIIHSKKGYAEMNLKDTGGELAADYVEERKLLGEEKVGKWDCKKYNVKSYLKSSPQTRSERTVWESKKDGIPVKVEMQDAQAKVVFLVEDIRFGAVSASLFELPAGYKKAASFMALFMEGLMPAEETQKTNETEPSGDDTDKDALEGMDMLKKLIGK